MDSPQPNIKKIAGLATAVLILIIFLVWFWNFLHTGKIVVTTNNPYATITLAPASEDSDSSKSHTAHGKLSESAKAGQYVISVQANSAATTETVSIKARKTLTYTINPINTTGVEPVAYEDAKDLAVDNNQLLYLNNSLGSLYKIDTTNTVSLVSANEDFKTIKWADASFGVGQDVNGHLYTIENGTINPLNVPFTYNGEDVNFDVAPNRQIYVSYGSIVYMVNAAGNSKQIYTATSADPLITASSDAVAVSDTVDGQNANDIAKPRLATITTSGKISKKNVEAEDQSWSPNSQYLVSVNESNPVIYNSSLRQIGTIPTKSLVSQFAWLDNNTLFYTTNDELWVYSLSGQKSELIANMPFANTITAIAISSDHSYVYLATNNSTAGDYTIRRVGLQDQSVPSFIYQLQDIMPQSSTNYSLSLINFKQPPVITVQPNYNAPSGNYAQIAASGLSSDGFDVSQLQFQVIESPDSGE